MSSIIEGYNYDIFISYRQKDNKGDRWVSEFVDALKDELESTFKEDISIYFDENPHDRLQDTHNVDKSLERKLKCLIFIPIVSQTYCDPRSYAWQYEFLAFNRLAEKDQYGKDVKLKSGNVTSRILPIRIHDLEQEDINLFEKEIGSVLRALDFVFKTSSGVNRPLRANEDHPNDNLNKTFYRDQINKVANAIKEIIGGLKTEPVTLVKEKTKQKEPSGQVSVEEKRSVQAKSLKLSKRKLLSGIAIGAIFVIAAILAYPKIFNSDNLENIIGTDGRIPIAVMPFQNMTNDNTMQTIIQNSIITSLSNNPEEFEVRQIESITGLLQSKDYTNYASITPSIARTISQKLDANVFIIGSITQVGTSLRLNAQLINSKTKETIKPFQIDGSAENIIPLSDSLSVMVSNYIIISILKKEALPSIQQSAGSTKSPKALGKFIEGQEAFMKRDYPLAIELFHNAIELDSNYILPQVFLAVAYGNNSNNNQARYWSHKVYEKRNKLSRLDRIYAESIYALYFGTPTEQLKYMRNVIELDDQQTLMYYNIGNVHNRINQFEKAIPELEKSLELYKKWEIKPMWVYNYTLLGLAYHEMGMYKKEKKLYKKAGKDFPDDLELIRRQAILALSEGKTKAASEYIEKYISILKGNSATEAAITENLAGIYSEACILDKAEEYYREALSLQSNGGRLNALAYFLIDNDRDIKEGLELTNRALEISPDNYEFLDTKGWGLYRQGQYKEAKDILQKSWDLRMKNAIYNHEAFLHLEEAEKAVASQKSN